MYVIDFVFRFGFGLGQVWFSSVIKAQFGSDIIVIYYSCNSWGVNYSKYYGDSGWHDFDITYNN